MPLTDKGRKIMQNMRSEYGPGKAERVFYASRNKGTIRGVDRKGSRGRSQGRGGGRGGR